MQQNKQGDDSQDDCTTLRQVFNQVLPEEMNNDHNHPE